MEKEYALCLRCRKPLKNPEYRQRGYGKICWDKIKKNKSKKLFTFIK